MTLELLLFLSPSPKCLDSRSVDATGQKLDASDHLGNIAEPSAYSLLGGEVAPVLWR